jgi:hypothetical protein
MSAGHAERQNTAIAGDKSSPDRSGSRRRPRLSLCDGRVLGGEEVEETFDARDLQRVADTFVDADQGEGAAILIMAYVGADQGSDSGRINVRDVREINDQQSGILSANGILKLEESGEHNRPAQRQDALAGLRPLTFLNFEGFL